MVMIEVYLLILLKILGETDCTIRVFLLFGAWIMYSRTPQKYRATSHYNYSHIIYIEFKHYFSVITPWGSVNAA